MIIKYESNLPHTLPFLFTIKYPTTYSVIIEFHTSKINSPRDGGELCLGSGVSKEARTVGVFCLNIPVKRHTAATLMLQ